MTKNTKLEVVANVAWMIFGFVGGTKAYLDQELIMAAILFGIGLLYTYLLYVALTKGREEGGK